jgi:hypothetical protein
MEQWDTIAPTVARTAWMEDTLWHMSTELANLRERVMFLEEQLTPKPPYATGDGNRLLQMVKGE